MQTLTRALPHLPSQQVVAGVAVQVTHQVEACQHPAQPFSVPWQKSSACRGESVQQLTGRHNALFDPALNAVRHGIEQERLP